MPSEPRASDDGKRTDPADKPPPPGRGRQWPEVLLGLLAALWLVALLVGALGVRWPTPSTPAATPTLGEAVAVPAGRFADGAAFLTPGQAIDLLAYDGESLRLTAPARVAAVTEGTRPAVLLDMPAPAAATVRALLPGGTVVLQYVAATATPKAEVTPGATATPTPAPP